jgi:glycogen phosphorylase
MKHDPETRVAIDLISSNYLSHYEPGAFEPLRDTLLLFGDGYMHLADLKYYVETQERLGALYRDPGAWAEKAILNIASSGKFSADRTIHEYTTEIWKVEPCPIP